MEIDTAIRYSESRSRLDKAYRNEKPRFMACLRAAGRSLEEAEDLVREVHAEAAERMPSIEGIRNLPAWINSLFAVRNLSMALRHWIE